MLELGVEIFVEQIGRLHDVHVAIDKPIALFHHSLRNTGPVASPDRASVLPDGRGRKSASAAGLQIPPGFENRPESEDVQLQLRQIDPAALAVALVAGFGELHAFRAFEQRRRERAVLGDMAQKQFPAGAVAVLERLEIGQFLPLLVEIHRLRHFRAEKRARRRDRRLDEAAMQPGDGRAGSAVDLDLQADRRA